MRFHRLLAALAPVVLIAALATPAAAQSETVQTGGSPSAEPRPGTWTLTPFVSFTFGGDADTASLGLGGAFGYDLTTRLSFEGEFAYVFDLAGDEDDVEWSTTTLSANALYHFPLPDVTLVPYVTGGIGYIRSSVAFHDQDDSSSEVGFNVGGGVKAPLNDKMALRGDIRYFRFPDNAPSGWRIYGGLSWRIGQ